MKEGSNSIHCEGTRPDMVLEALIRGIECTSINSLKPKSSRNLGTYPQIDTWNQVQSMHSIPRQARGIECTKSDLSR
jgi:hypothetical protein